MYVQPFQLSMDTMLGIAPMLGHVLEDRCAIREAQDWAMVRRMQMRTSVSLRDASQKDLFAVAPIDVLVTQAEGRNFFHFVEINGTGIGGLTNMTGSAISAVLEDLSQFAQSLPNPEALVLVASSGKESEASPRHNKLLHEKILYVEALKRGFEFQGHNPRILTMIQVLQDPTLLANHQPTVLLGYMKDFLPNLKLDATGKLFLFGRQVNGAVNDRFCLNILQQFDRLIDLHEFLPMNRCFLAGGDKGITYGLLNEYLAIHPHDCIPGKTLFERVADREQMRKRVLAWVRAGRKTVIKPQGTGLGHGIEFFLDPREDEQSITERLDASIRFTEEHYGLRGGAFPYTICEFLESSTIAEPQHPLAGHKFELRIVVYREEMQLKAFPSIVKIASEAYDPARPTKMSLLNNITASAQAKHRPGVEFMLPLANRSTMKLIGLEVGDLLDVCEAATGFIRFLMDKMQDQPETLGLPALSIASSR